MSKNYSGEGNVMDVTLAAAATAGVPIAIGGLLGVPVTDGAIGDTIAVSIGGVHNLLAVTGAAFTQGETVTWDSSVDLVDDAAAIAATGDLTLGCVAMETVASAGAGSRIAVKLNVAVNTVT